MARGRLLNSLEAVLDEDVTLKSAKLQTGDSLILQIRQACITSTGRNDECAAFAALLGDGSVVAWGANWAGEYGAVQDRLKNVQAIQASDYWLCRQLGRCGV